MTEQSSNREAALSRLATLYAADPVQFGKMVAALTSVSDDDFKKLWFSWEFLQKDEQRRKAEQAFLEQALPLTEPCATAGPSVATGRTAGGNSTGWDAELSSFWTGLRSAKLEEGPEGEHVLTLPDGMTFPGPYQHMRQLLQLNSYGVAWQQMKTVLGKGSVRRFLLRGTPGIGKSVFLLYLLHRLALEGRTVVWWAPEAFSGRAILFTPGGAFKAADPLAFEDELDDPATWFLHDAADYPEQPAVTVMVSSPRRDRYNNFTKTKRHSLWFGPWSLDELKAAWRLNDLESKITLGKVMEAYNAWGGIPRTVLQDTQSDTCGEEYESILDDADAAMVLKEARKIKSMAADVSHMLLHIQADEQCRLKAVVFASDKVAKHILSRVEVTPHQDLEEFLTASVNSPTLASLRGVFFESYGLKVILEGGSFRVRDLATPTCGPITLTLPRATMQHVATLNNVTTLNGASSSGHLLIPDQRNFPAIDGVLVLPTSAELLTPAPQVLLLQSTVSTDHPIKQAGLLSALDQLGQSMTTAVFFVVPPDVFEQFPKQRLVGVEGQKLEKQDPATVAIPQYALEVRFDGANAVMPAAQPGGSNIQRGNAMSSTAIRHVQRRPLVLSRLPWHRPMAARPKIL